MSDYNFRLGMNAKAYRAASTFSASDSAAVEGATLSEIDNIRDVTINLETGEADITTRANNGWRQTAATLKDGSVEFEMVAKRPDANLDAIRSAWLGGTEIGLVFLTGDKNTVGSEGPAGNYTITRFSRTEALEDAVKYQVTAKPSSQTQWYTKGT